MPVNGQPAPQDFLDNYNQDNQNGALQTRPQEPVKESQQLCIEGFHLLGLSSLLVRLVIFTGGFCLTENLLQSGNLLSR